NEAGIQSCNLIRFRDKLPQKLGGWEKFFPQAVSGVPRSLHAWEDLNESSHLSIGTVGTGTTLSVITDGILQNIVPQSTTTNFPPQFTTSPGSNVIGVNDYNLNNLTINDAVFFDTPVSVGGVVIQGLWPIASVTGTTSYTINFLDAATSTATGTGAVPI